MRPPPPDIAALLRGRAAQPVTTGESGAHVARYVRAGARGLYLKAAAIADGGSPEGGGPLGGEAARLRWMAVRGVPVPAVHRYVLHEGWEYLVLDEVPGSDAATVASAATVTSTTGGGHAARAAVVHALADALRRLHATDAADCPFRHPASSRIAEARERARRGLVDERDFDEERRGRRAEDLVDELEALRPAAETPRLTHGDCCLPNVILRVEPRLDAEDDVTVAGFVDCGRAGLADPYQDLALAARSVAWNLGPPWVPELFRRYGIERVDERKLRFYTLLDEFF
jgi:aminoglycoside 3'-phosphotransferase-2